MSRDSSRDDPRYGASLQPVALMLLVGSSELIIWVWCNIQQITTTHDAIFGLLQGATNVSHLTAEQALALLQGNMGKNHQIAYTIAFVTQIVFLISSFSISHIW